jgi:hypothetical protein
MLRRERDGVQVQVQVVVVMIERMIPIRSMADGTGTRTRVWVCSGRHNKSDVNTTKSIAGEGQEGEGGSADERGARRGEASSVQRLDRRGEAR